MKTTLKSALASALAAQLNLEQEAVLSLLTKPKNPSHGDIAFPCFAVAKEQKVKPQELAQELAQSISLPDGISKTTALGPFLNFSLDRTSLTKAVIESTQGKKPQKKKIKPVILEYSSPNIAKPFHVGHLRATLVGNALDRMYRYSGTSVISINHLGDWGTQFGFVYAGCKLWGKPKNATVHDLVELYRQATSLKEVQERGAVQKTEKDLPEIEPIARDYFLRLEKGEKEAKEFWIWCRDISLKYFQAAYERLGVHFNYYHGESFYSDKLDAVKKDLEKSEILEESEGALGVHLGEELGFARIYTPDGRSLYLTRDIATAKYRAQTFSFQKSIYVVGAPQTLHFKQLKAILKAEGHTWAENIIHVAFGHVKGVKTRGDGEFIELNSFLDEARERALQAYKEQVTRRPEGLDENLVAERVGLAAIIFSNLSRTRTKDVHFSWKNALQFQGDTGPYLLYACARINGIKEKARGQGIECHAKIDASLLTDDSAYLLTRTILAFEEVLQRALVENEPAQVANYALELAKAFSKAYTSLHVLDAEKPIAEARLALFEATRRTLAQALELLGIQTLERM